VNCLVTVSFHLRYCYFVLQGTYLTSAALSHAREHNLPEGPTLGSFNGEFWGVLASTQVLLHLYWSYSKSRHAHIYYSVYFFIPQLWSFFFLWTREFWSTEDPDLCYICTMQVIGNLISLALLRNGKVSTALQYSKLQISWTFHYVPHTSIQYQKLIWGSWFTLEYHDLLFL
jgi:hypothetical protein